MEPVYATIGLVWGAVMLLVALGLSLALRPWGPHPALRPWVASYWCLALMLGGAGILGFLIRPLLQQDQRLVTLGLASLANVICGGLQIVGWIRFTRPRTALGWALIPPMTYLILASSLGALHHSWTRVLLNTSFQTFLNLAMAILAHQGLSSRGSVGRIALPAVLTFHAGFNVVRGILAWRSPQESDQFILLLAGISEALVFYLILAYLQWLILSEEPEG